MPGERSKRWGGSKWCRPEKRLAIYRRDRFRCSWCGRHVSEVALCLDHLIRVADGGGNEASNLVTSCFLCNRDREHLAPRDWPVFLAAFWDRPDDVVATAVVRARTQELDRRWAREQCARPPSWLKALRARASKAFVAELVEISADEYPDGELWDE